LAVLHIVPVSDAGGLASTGIGRGQGRQRVITSSRIAAQPLISALLMSWSFVDFRCGDPMREAKTG
jgi:hypothetical protein